MQETKDYVIGLDYGSEPKRVKQFHPLLRKYEAIGAFVEAQTVKSNPSTIEH
ncbi:hypothetical protein [Neolewinella lacunae]|uniref:hypothetical protein n=1 Tax=Neolewinella lacunae TaxID=1517758 RepID=UPI001CA3FC9C|nr:hypothetical protein [Neolewinella lacunae]